MWQINPHCLLTCMLKHIRLYVPFFAISALEVELSAGLQASWVDTMVLARAKVLTNGVCKGLTTLNSLMLAVSGVSGAVNNQIVLYLFARGIEGMIRSSVQVSMFVSGDVI